MRKVIAAILFASMSFGVLVTLTSGAEASSTPAQQWAVQFVGGKAGPATSSLPPVTIGVIQPVGVDAGAYPGLGATIQAAAKYVNRQLGGIGGHPLKLAICPVTDSQDGQNCGEEFANNPKMAAVVNGINIFDDTALLQALAAKPLPVFLPLAITAAELTATNAANFGPGIPAYYPAFVQYLDQNGDTNKSISVIYGDNSGGQATVALLKPLLTASHITNVTYVAAPNDGTAPQYTSAIEAAGATHAQVVMMLSPDTVCVGVGDALKSLGVTPQAVLVTNGCLDKLVTSHYGGHLPSTWRVFNFGNSPYVAGLDTGVDSYLAAMKTYAPTVDPGTPAYLMFGSIITADKVINKIGYANATPASILKGLLNFTGPAMMEPGPMKCGYIKSTPSVCGNEVAVDRWVGKKYSESIVTVGSL